MPAGHESARFTLEVLAASSLARSLAGWRPWCEAEREETGREKGEERTRRDGGGVLVDGSLI